MRLSDSQVFDNVRRQLTTARENAIKAQDQASSGLRVSKPSDDPVAAAAARRESSRKALADAGVSATDTATTLLEGSDAALSDVFEGLTHARELGLAAASSSSSPENRTAAAEQVRKIREQMVALGNTNVAGKYVFAGYRDQTPAFDKDGSFVGDNSVKETQALPGTRVASSISGEAVFGTNQADDMFSALDRLASALDANDTDAIRASFDDLEKNQDRVLASRSQIGAMLDSVKVVGAVAEQHSYRAELEVGRLTGIDEVTAATNLMQAKSALEAALTIAQQIPAGSLAGGK